VIEAITLDCRGTLLLDRPASDDRYERRRLAAMKAILARAEVTVSDRDLDRAYREAVRFVARIWSQRRDVPVTCHATSLRCSRPSIRRFPNA
jgi:hypothetical protein